jgi:hypothetical protein
VAAGDKGAWPRVLKTSANVHHATAHHVAAIVHHKTALRHHIKKLYAKKRHPAAVASIPERRQERF